MKVIVTRASCDDDEEYVVELNTMEDLKNFMIKVYKEDEKLDSLGQTRVWSWGASNNCIISMKSYVLETHPECELELEIYDNYIE